MKYGIKSILRAPLKTLLFFFLLAAVTLFLSLGAGMWRSAEKMLTDADAVFLSVGDFTYTGGNYPGTSEPDPYLQEAAEAFDKELLNSKEVSLSEESYNHRANLEGYSPHRNDMPYGEYAVLFVSATVRELDGETAYTPDDLYPTSLAWGSLYSVRNMDSKLIVLFPPDSGAHAEQGEDYPLQDRHKYAVFGEFFHVSGTNFIGFQIKPFSAIGLTDAPYPPIVEIEGSDYVDDFLLSGIGKFYQQTANRLRTINETAYLVATKDIRMVSEFHAGDYTLVDGSYFTQDDYQNGGVCILPRQAASQIQAKIGDTVRLSVQPQGANIEGSFVSEEYATVVGIYQSDENEAPIYIPNIGQDWLQRGETDYLLGRVLLRNRDAADYAETVKALLPPGVQFSWSDQGYAAAVRPILALREAALLITAICAFACFLLLWFFGFFYIFRSRETARIMLVLGTRTGGIMRYFLSGSGLIALMASAAGCAFGYSLSAHLVAAVFSAMEESRDLRFSIGSYGVKSDEFAAAASTSLIWFVLVGVLVFFAALGMCGVFAAFRISSQNPRRIFQKKEKRAHKLRSKHAPKHASGARFSARLPTVALRYCVKSILRGGKRSLAVPVLFAVLLSFLSVFSAARLNYREQLDNVYDDIPVTARFTDKSGRKTDNLLLDEKQMADFAQTGFTDELWFSVNLRIQVVEKVEPLEWQEMLNRYHGRAEIPEGTYVYDTFLSQLMVFTDPLIGTSDFARSPEFLFADTPEVEFANGFDWDKFYAQTQEGYEEAQFCVVSSRFLQENELALGDYIVVNIFTKDLSIAQKRPLIVGGVFNSGTGRRNVYMPNDWVSIEIKGDVISTFTFGLFTGFFYDEADRGIYATDTHVAGNTMVVEYVPEDTDPEERLEWWREYINTSFSQRDSTWVFEEYEYFDRYNAAGATIKNTQNLSGLKDWLEEHYDPLGSALWNRKWVILDDEALYNTIDSLTRHIGYMDMLTPLIFALVAVIGFLISTLLLKSRAQEIGVLRGVGSSKPGIYLALLAEQIILSAPGLAAGILLPAVFAPQTNMLFNAALFALCYYTGSSIAILHTYRDKAIRNLAKREE